MSQHDMNIANQGFPAFRADLNDALVALVSNNSGASAPATTFANMPWYDTTNNIFKIRNEDNDDWISVFTLDQTGDVVSAVGSLTLTDIVSLAGTQTLTNKTLTTPKINVINEETLNAGVTIDSVLLKDNTVSSLKQILLGSTSGSVEVSTPAVAGTQTVTLPAASGQLMVSGNQPAFSAYLNSNQSVSNGTYTKAQINTKVFDTASCYDNTTNYRFTPNVAGYYQVNACVTSDSSTTNPSFSRTAIYKNGSIYALATMSGSSSGSATNSLSPALSAVIYMNGSTDYLEIYGFMNGATGGLFYTSGTTLLTHFSASLVRAA